MYEGLELSVNEEFVVYGTMVKIVGNFEEAQRQGILFDIKSLTCYWKAVFVPMLWQ